MNLHLKMMVGGKLRTATVKKASKEETEDCSAFYIYFDDFDIEAIFDYNEDIVLLCCFGREAEYGDEAKDIARFALKAFKSIGEPDIAYVLNDFRSFEESEDEYYESEPEGESDSDTESEGEPMEIPEGW